MKRTIRFDSRKQSVKGMIALIMGTLDFIGTVCMIITSGGSGGESGLWLGVLAILLTVAAVIGLCLALRAMYERDVAPVIPLIALIVNGVLVIFYLCSYIIGLV